MFNPTLPYAWYSYDNINLAWNYPYLTQQCESAVYRKGRTRIRVRMPVTLLRLHIEIPPLDWQFNNLIYHQFMYLIYIIVYIQFIYFQYKKNLCFFAKNIFQMKNINICCEKHLLAKHVSFACTIQSVTRKK